MMAGSIVMLSASVPATPRAMAGPVVLKSPTSARAIEALARTTVSAEPAMTTPTLDDAMRDRLVRVVTRCGAPRGTG